MIYTLGNEKGARKEVVSMKIEKISDTQIRCTLTAQELSDRDLKVSELAYGSEKAKKLFQDMMEQANLDFGFGDHNNRVMVEVLPTAEGSLIMLITQIDPENAGEISQRIRGISADGSINMDTNPFFKKALDSEEHDFTPELEDELDIDDLLRKNLQEDEKSVETHEFSVHISPSKKEKSSQSSNETSDGNPSAPSPKRIVKDIRMYSFDSLELAISACQSVDFYSIPVSTLWKNRKDNRYYLIVISLDMRDINFHRNCSKLGEYGRREECMDSTREYFREHHLLILKGRAVQKLSSLSMDSVEPDLV